MNKKEPKRSKEGSKNLALLALDFSAKPSAHRPILIQNAVLILIYCAELIMNGMAISRTIGNNGFLLKYIESLFIFSKGVWQIDF